MWRIKNNGIKYFNDKVPYTKLIPANNNNGGVYTDAESFESIKMKRTMYNEMKIPSMTKLSNSTNVRIKFMISCVNKTFEMK